MLWRPDTDGERIIIKFLLFLVLNVSLLHCLTGKCNNFTKYCYCKLLQINLISCDEQSGQLVMFANKSWTDSTQEIPFSTLKYLIGCWQRSFKTSNDKQATVEVDRLELQTLPRTPTWHHQRLRTAADCIENYILKIICAFSA